MEEPSGRGDFQHGDLLDVQVRDHQAGRRERMNPDEDGDHGPPPQWRKPRAEPCQFDGTGALFEFLRHFRLVAELNEWTNQERGMYLGMSLSGSVLKILETVDASAPDGYEQLLEVLERRYQPADQVALYWTQL